MVLNTHLHMNSGAMIPAILQVHNLHNLRLAPAQHVSSIVKSTMHNLDNLGHGEEEEEEEEEERSLIEDLKRHTQPTRMEPARVSSPQVRRVASRNILNSKQHRAWLQRHDPKRISNSQHRQYTHSFSHTHSHPFGMVRPILGDATHHLHSDTMFSWGM